VTPVSEPKIIAIQPTFEFSAALLEEVEAALKVEAVEAAPKAEEAVTELEVLCDAVAEA